MLIETTRFGRVEVAGDKLITFEEGILGFPGLKRYGLIQTSPDPVFFWLQSTENPTLAFVVCDPLAFVEGYNVPIKAEDLAERLEVSRQSVNAIETGRYDPSLPLAFKIADVFGLTIEEISTALDRANVSAPGGTILQGRYRYPLRTLGEFQTVEEIGEVVVARQALEDLNG
ncbi:MAG: flagellar assembly protein FliW [Proteobacteria bacterium]|nr:flagellar assembly protein FliW [Pseudomonadota bacterium]